MDVVVADPGVVMAKPSVNTPAAAIWNSTEFLDIDMDQVAGVFVLVAADDLAGRAIHPTQPVEVPAHQHAMHGRRGQVQPDGDTDGTELGAAAQRLDLSFHPGRCSPRAPQRP